ncbi:MAG TPA: lysylphosphatidylglycerol synthase transmembrane domain-containing protein [Kofleriaceae bacterium]|nr:lysylphosphatidylglycerol synthase transmembrane domain-containing protein [Kofleriaceae bacterium]
MSLVLGLVAFVFTLDDIGPTTFARYFKLIGWWWFAVLAFEIAITTLDAVAIRAFASPEQAQLPLRSALLAQLAGRSVNAVTPTGSLGEPVKISVLTDNVSNSRAVSTILLYNVVGFTVELMQVAIAAPFMALLLPMPHSLRLAFIAVGIVSGLLAIGIYALVHRGMLASVARLGVRLRLLSQARFARWEAQLASVDDKLRLVSGARKRDRIAGVTAVIVSRACSLLESLVLLHAIGQSMSVGFIAAYTVGGFAIYMLSSLVPMGLGVAEGGYYSLFAALHYNKAFGVMLVLARRCVLLAYAAIGLVLVATTETVQRAKEQLRVRRESMQTIPLPVRPASVSVAPPIAVPREAD